MDDHNNNQGITQSLLQQLIKVVEKFSDTVSSLKDIVIHDEKRYEEFTRDSQKRHEAFAHETQKRHEEFVLDKQRRDEHFLTETRQRYEDLSRLNRAEDEMQKNRMRRDAYIVTFISVFAICISLLATCYWSYQGKKIDYRRVELTKHYNEQSDLINQIDILQRAIDERLSKRDMLMDAMVKVRGLRDEGQRNCKNGVYVGPDPALYNQKLFDGGYFLVGAAYKIMGVFDENVNKNVLQFEALSNVDKVGVCEKKAATDKDLMPLQTNINLLILESVMDLDKQKKELLNKLQQQKIKKPE